MFQLLRNGLVRFSNRFGKTKKGKAKRRPATSIWARPCLELLEDRTLLSTSHLPPLPASTQAAIDKVTDSIPFVSDIQNEFDQVIKTVMDAVPTLNGEPAFNVQKLPIIGDALHRIQDLSKSITDFQNDIKGALTKGDMFGLDVRVTDSPLQGDYVHVTVPFRKTFDLFDHPFDLGLGKVLSLTVTGTPHVQIDFGYDLQFDYLTTPNFLGNRIKQDLQDLLPTKDNPVRLYASAELSSGSVDTSSITGRLGDLLYVQAKDHRGAPDPSHGNLQGTAVSGNVEMTLDRNHTPHFTVAGHAQIDLDLDAGLGRPPKSGESPLPINVSVHTEFKTGWDYDNSKSADAPPDPNQPPTSPGGVQPQSFPGSLGNPSAGPGNANQADESLAFGDISDLQFLGVSVDLGVQAPSFLGPVLNLIHQFTDLPAIKQVLDIAETDIPLIHKRLIDLADLTGQLPQGVAPVVDALLALRKLDVNNGLLEVPLANVGNFDLGSIAHDAENLLHTSTFDISSLGVAGQLIGNAAGQALQSVEHAAQTLVQGTGGSGGSLGGSLAAVASGAAGPGGFEFPFLHDRAALVKFLLGQDIDLVRFTTPPVKAHLNVVAGLDVFGLVQAGLTGQLDFSMNLALAYNTKGIRDLLASGHPLDLFDGFYIDTAHTGISLSASVGLSVGAGFTIKGGITGNVAIGVPPSRGESSKRYFTDLLSDCLLEASGALSVDASVTAQVSLPLVGSITLFHLTLAHADLLNFHSDCDGQSTVDHQHTIFLDPTPDRFPTYDGNASRAVYVHAYYDRDAGAYGPNGVSYANTVDDLTGYGTDAEGINVGPIPLGAEILESGIEVDYGSGEIMRYPEVIRVRGMGHWRINSYDAIATMSTNRGLRNEPELGIPDTGFAIFVENAFDVFNNVPGDDGPQHFVEPGATSAQPHVVVLAGGAGDDDLEFRDDDGIGKAMLIGGGGKNRLIGGAREYGYRPVRDPLAPQVDPQIGVGAQVLFDEFGLQALATPNDDTALRLAYLVNNAEQGGGGVAAGDPGEDILVGTTGNDVLFGGPVVNHFDGLVGADKYYVDPRFNANRDKNSYTVQIGTNGAHDVEISNFNNLGDSLVLVHTRFANEDHQGTSLANFDIEQPQTITLSAGGEADPTVLPALFGSGHGLFVPGTTGGDLARPPVHPQVYIPTSFSTPGQDPTGIPFPSVDSVVTVPVAPNSGGLINLGGFAIVDAGSNPPAWLAAGGKFVLISGRGFSFGTGSVTFEDSATQNFLVLSDSLILAAPTPHPAGRVVDVTVGTRGGTSAFGGPGQLYQFPAENLVVRDINGRVLVRGFGIVNVTVAEDPDLSDPMTVGVASGSLYNTYVQKVDVELHHGEQLWGPLHHLHTNTVSVYGSLGADDIKFSGGEVKLSHGTTVAIHNLGSTGHVASVLDSIGAGPSGSADPGSGADQLVLDGGGGVDNFDVTVDRDTNYQIQVKNPLQTVLYSAAGKLEVHEVGFFTDKPVNVTIDRFEVSFEQTHVLTTQTSLFSDNRRAEIFYTSALNPQVSSLVVDTDDSTPTTVTVDRPGADLTVNGTAAKETVKVLDSRHKVTVNGRGGDDDVQVEGGSGGFTFMAGPGHPSVSFGKTSQNVRNVGGTILINGDANAEYAGTTVNIDDSMDNVDRSVDLQGHFLDGLLGGEMVFSPSFVGAVNLSLPSFSSLELAGTSVFASSTAYTANLRGGSVTADSLAPGQTLTVNALDPNFPTFFDSTNFTAVKGNVLVTGFAALGLDATDFHQPFSRAVVLDHGDRAQQERDRELQQRFGIIAAPSHYRIHGLAAGDISYTAGISILLYLSAPPDYDPNAVNLAIDATGGDVTIFADIGNNIAVGGTGGHLTVHGGAKITVGWLAQLGGGVTVDLPVALSSRGPATTLVLDATGLPFLQHIVVDANTVSPGLPKEYKVSGFGITGMDFIQQSKVALSVLGGTSDGNTYTVNDGADLSITAPAGSVYLLGTTGNVQVGAGSSIVLGIQPDAQTGLIPFGNGTTAALHGRLSLGAYTTLGGYRLPNIVIDDSADSRNLGVTIGRQSSLLGTASFFHEITGLAPATIVYEGTVNPSGNPGLTHLQIIGGSGINTFTVNDSGVQATTLAPGAQGIVNVYGTSGTLFVQGGKSVAIGLGSLANILGAVNVDAAAGQATGPAVVINDFSDTDSHQVRIGPKPLIHPLDLFPDVLDINGLAPAEITLNRNTVKTLFIVTGSGNDTYTLLDSPHIKDDLGFVDAIGPFLSGLHLSITSSSGTKFLVGPDLDNTWDLTGPGAGTLNGTVSFSGMTTGLRGGSLDDAFHFHSSTVQGFGFDLSTPTTIAGFVSYVDGGYGGTNTLDFSASPVPAHVSMTGELIRFGIAGFEGVDGQFTGRFDDPLYGTRTDTVGSFARMTAFIGNAGSTLDTGSNGFGTSASHDPFLPRPAQSFTGSVTAAGFAHTELHFNGNFAGQFLAPSLAALSVQVDGTLTANAILKTNTLNYLTVMGDLAGTVKVFGAGLDGSQLYVLGDVSVGGNLAATGSITAPIIATVSIGGASIDPTTFGDLAGIINETSATDDMQSLTVFGSITATGEVHAANIAAMDIGIDLAGKVLVAGPLGTGIIGRDLSGELQADSIGTLTIGRHLSGNVSAAATIQDIEMIGDFHGKITADDLRKLTIGGDASGILDVAHGIYSHISPASLSGLVFEDFNDDGLVDFGERGISGVSITLAGTDYFGHSVNLTQQTDSDGAYVFLNLRPGTYTLSAAQPAGYGQGIDSVGTAGGSLQATDQFFVQLGQGVNGLNYNYGERPAAGAAVQHGQTAGIGFWNNKNGQALILALNGGTGYQLGNWLAATLPNIFGGSAGSSNLAGKSNAAVAALFQSDFQQKGQKLDAQVLAMALAVYVTNATLDPTLVAAQYGFTVSGDGVGTATVNVGSNGDAFGVANNTTVTVMDLLLATNQQVVNGQLYNGNTIRRNKANNVYSAVNQTGDIG